MGTRRPIALALSIGALSMEGCAPAAAATPQAAPGSESARSTSTSDEDSKSPWTSCYSSFAPAGDAEGDLLRLVRDCGPTGGMRAVTPVRVGRQSSEDPVDRYTFEVPSP